MDVIIGSHLAKDNRIPNWRCVVAFVPDHELLHIWSWWHFLFTMCFWYNVWNLFYINCNSDFLVPFLFETVWAGYFRVHIQPIWVSQVSASCPSASRRKEPLHHHVISVSCTICFSLYCSVLEGTDACVHLYPLVYNQRFFRRLYLCNLNFSEEKEKETCVYLLCETILLHLDFPFVQDGWVSIGPRKMIVSSISLGERLLAGSYF